MDKEQQYNDNPYFQHTNPASNENAQFCTEDSVDRGRESVGKQHKDIFNTNDKLWQKQNRQGGRVMKAKQGQKLVSRNQADILGASSLSCVLTMVLTNPLEVVKLKAQYSPISCSKYPHNSFRDLYNCACTKLNIKDSFKGLHLNLFQGLISAVLYMQVYQYCRGKTLSYLSNRNTQQKTTTNFESSLATLSSAFTARILVTSLLVPIQTMRIRFTNTSTPIAQQNIFSSSTNKGLRVTMVRDLSYSCLLWLTIQSIRNSLVGQQYRHADKSAQNHKTHKYPQLQKILYANVIPAFIGANLISILTTPLDTIKTRIQSGVQFGNTNSITKQMKMVYSKEGVIGLFSGVQYRAIKNSISSVLYITMYEYFLEKASKTRNLSKI